ncbi:MAG: nucleotide exchange factor GrpE [DPANN group archaeon]|nr:nucleotide exchange factor GrpE [DPANN group archaeon]
MVHKDKIEKNDVKHTSENDDVSAKEHTSEDKIEVLLDPKSQLEAEIKKSSSYLGHIQQLQADFENFKKYSEKERQDVIKNANGIIIKKLLPIVDDLERAIISMENDEDRKGVELVFKNLMKTLSEMGLKKIETVDKMFDSYYHEVLLKCVSEKNENMILEELQAGYMVGSNVIRHSKVKISGGNKNG